MDIERIGFWDGSELTWMEKCEIEFAKSLNKVTEDFIWGGQKDEFDFERVDPISPEALQRMKDSYLDEGKEGPFKDTRANFYPANE